VNNRGNPTTRSATLPHRGSKSGSRGQGRPGAHAETGPHPGAETHPEAAEGEHTSGGITFRLRDLRRPGPGLLAATVEYQVQDRVWRQWFTARRLDDGELAAARAGAGLAVDAYLTGDGSWVRAVPSRRGDALGCSPR